MKKIMRMIMGVVVAGCALLQGMEKNVVDHYKQDFPADCHPSRQLVKCMEYDKNEIWNGIGFCREEFIDRLQTEGAELNPEVYRGMFLIGEQMFTPLHIACSVGNCSGAEILLKKGAKIDVKDWSNEFPWNTLLRKMSERYYGFVYFRLQWLEKTYTLNKTEQLQAFFDKITSPCSIEHSICQRLQGKISGKDLENNLQEIELMISRVYIENGINAKTVFKKTVEIEGVKYFEDVRRNISDIRAMNKLLPKLYFEGVEKNISKFVH